MNIKKDTIIRTIVLLVALLNTVLTAIGKNPLPFSEESLYAGLSAVFTVLASLWTWWKNNSFTKEAIAADDYMHELKLQSKESN